MEKKLGIGFPWVNLEESRAAELLARLRKESPDVYDGWELTVARYLRPRFYARHALIEVRIARGDAIRVRYLLDGDDAMLPLEGRSDPIHAANASEGLVLNAETVLDYLRFFVFFLRGSDGPFTLLEAELELLPSDGETVTPELEELRSHIRPLRIGGQDGQGRFLVPATVAYDGTMWRTTLAVSTGGEVEMIDEKDPVALGTALVPQCPYLDAPAAEAPATIAETTPSRRRRKKTQRMRPRRSGLPDRRRWRRPSRIARSRVPWYRYCSPTRCASGWAIRCSSASIRKPRPTIRSRSSHAS